MNGDRALNYDERSQQFKAIAAIAGLCHLINTAPLGLLVGAKLMIRYAQPYLVLMSEELPCCGVPSTNANLPQLPALLVNVSWI